MMRCMNMEEAIAQATAELEGRSAQMTHDELLEAITDRARVLAGELPLARLKQGRRLLAREAKALRAGAELMLSDFTDVAVLGDARVRGDHVDVMFRLTHRPDCAYVVTVAPRPGDRRDFTALGSSAAVAAYDHLTEPGVVAKMIRRQP